MEVIGQQGGGKIKMKINNQVYKMSYYLLRFRHEIYCQGFETTQDIRLVYACDLDQAKQKLKAGLKKVHDIENLTIK